MKKVLIVINALALMIIISFTMTVYGTPYTYELPEMGLEITIPSEFLVITRNTPDFDRAFYTLGITKDEAISHFESSNIYLNAISNSSEEEIVVTMTPDDLSNFSLLSDASLNVIASMLSDQYEEYGLDLLDYEIYQHSQAKFIKINFTDTAKTVHGLQYYTIYDNKTMNFTMRSYIGRITPNQESTIKTVVDSIKYNTEPLIPEPGEDTDSFTYTDTDSKVVFTVPANWKQEEFTEEREFIDAKFVSTKEKGCTIIYGSGDVWKEMSASERSGYSRSDISNSFITESFIADMYDTTADKISLVTYNGVQYYKCELTTSTDMYGLDIPVTMTSLININNGWMYTFQFGGTSESIYFADFESLLNSVQYPEDSKNSGTDSTVKTADTVSNQPDSTADKTETGSTRSDSSDNTAIVISLLIVIGIIVTIVAVRKNNSEYLKRK